ncbi:MAG: hypothetical protein P4L90_29900 [Rhodopila sp.]|nr:hypothetical protein [Rhodopila sp.]
MGITTDLCGKIVAEPANHRLSITPPAMLARADPREISLMPALKAAPRAVRGFTAWGVASPMPARSIRLAPAACRNE